MSDNDAGFWGFVFVIVVMIFVFFAGVAIGFDMGQDDIANDWCVSLGYDTGEYDKGVENISCKSITNLEIKKGE